MQVPPSMRFEARPTTCESGNAHNLQIIYHDLILCGRSHVRREFFLQDRDQINWAVQSQYLQSALIESTTISLLTLPIACVRWSIASIRSSDSRRDKLKHFS